jgi:hypothetical protein
LAASVGGLFATVQLRDAEAVVSLKGTGTPLNGEEAQRLLEMNREMANPYALVLWGVKETSYIDNPAVGRHSKVNVILVNGELDLLFPGCFLTPQRPDDCVLDQKTAYALFGDTDIVGLKVTYGDKEYTVAKVIACDNPVFLIQSTSPNDSGYESITVRNDGFTTAATVQEQVSQRLGFPCELLEYDNLFAIAWYFWWIPLLVLTVLLLAYIRRQYVLAKSDRVYRWLWLGLFVLVCCGFIVPFVLTLYVPADGLPSKWSNFELWREVFERRRASLQFLFQAPVRAPELWHYATFFKSVGLSAVALILALMLAYGLKAKTTTVTEGRTPWHMFRFKK